MDFEMWYWSGFAFFTGEKVLWKAILNCKSVFCKVNYATLCKNMSVHHSREKNQDVEGDLLFWQVWRWQVRVQACYVAKGCFFCLFPFLSKLFLNPDNHTVQALAKLVPKTHCMSEQEWRNLGVQQSLGWVVHTFPSCSPLSKFRKLALYAIRNCCSSLLKVCFQLIFWRWVHYMLHEPEPHILLFRCLQLLRKPWFHFIRPFSTGGPCPTSDLQCCLNGRKYMITENFIGDAFERTYM